MHPCWIKYNLKCFINNYPSSSVRNLGVIFDDQLTFKDHIAKTARSCRFALHNIRKIRPFLTEHAAQLLVQALVISRLDYCNALLAGFHHAQSNLYGMTGLQRTQKGPCHTSLYLPALAPSCRTLMLAYRTATGSAPTYFHSILTIYIPSRIWDLWVALDKSVC